MLRGFVHGSRLADWRDAVSLFHYMPLMRQTDNRVGGLKSEVQHLAIR
ncbi:hypothetical protein THIX_30002 [Thiomonas sp. X19]|nr:hypothetical protein THIX_30002 [Thiomonas sp. X19]